MREFGLARKLNKRLFGVLVDDPFRSPSLPADLTDTWQVVDLASGQDHLMLRVTLPRTHDGSPRHVLQGGARAAAQWAD